MSSVFSTIFRNFSLFLSIILRKFCFSGFEYKKFIFNEQDQKIKISYILNGISQEDPLEDFLKSDFFLALSKQQILKLIWLHGESIKKIKKYSLLQDENCFEIFDVLNKDNGHSVAMNVKNIFENNEIIENISAEEIRKVFQIYGLSFDENTSTDYKSHLTIV